MTFTLGSAIQSLVKTIYAKLVLKVFPTCISMYKYSCPSTYFFTVWIGLAVKSEKQT